MTTLRLTMAIASLTAATVATRTAMLFVGERLRLSPRIESALRFAPACALTALILPEILYPNGALDLTLRNPRWPAAVLAALFLTWRPTMLGGIAVGMAAYALLKLL